MFNHLKNSLFSFGAVFLIIRNIEKQWNSGLISSCLWGPDAPHIILTYQNKMFHLCWPSTLSSKYYGQFPRVTKYNRIPSVAFMGDMGIYKLYFPNFIFYKISVYFSKQQQTPRLWTSAYINWVVSVPADFSLRWEKKNLMALVR
jgi:hypothetical protein